MKKTIITALLTGLFALPLLSAIGCKDKNGVTNSTTTAGPSGTSSTRMSTASSSTAK